MINISKKYQPLFDLPRARGKVNDPDFLRRISQKRRDYWISLSKVEVVVETGGRGSGKSLITCVDASNRSAIYDHRTLYTRYTDTSLDDSVKPDFEKALTMLNYGRYADMRKGRILFPKNGAKIVFRGLKPSSKNQTAVGKSLSDFSCFVCEEAEEHPSFEEWEKVALSMRYPSVQNYSILILNPTTKEHWIYTEFFEDRGVSGGFNGIKDEVLYIHTTYLDVKKEYHTATNWNKFERGRKCFELIEAMAPEDRINAENRTRKLHAWYKHVVLGGWLDKAQGVIFPDWIEGDFPEELPTVYGLDFGYSPDPCGMVKTAIDKDARKIYFEEILYKLELSTDQIEDEIRRNCHEDDLIIGDCAEKRLIIELRSRNINIVPCEKGADSIRKGIKDMQGYQIIVCGESPNLRRELNNYCYNDKKAGIPIDNYNHLIDGGRYAFNQLARGFFVS